MSTPDTGGPAFPTYPTHTPGQSLRDWFAGQALTGLLAACAQQSNVCSQQDRAAEAYSQADAMLEERAKPVTPPKLSA